MHPARFGEGEEHRHFGMWDTRCIPGTALPHRPMGHSILWGHPDPAGKGWEPPWHHSVLSHRLAMCGAACCMQGRSGWLLSACAQGRGSGTSEGKVGRTLPLWTSVVTGDHVGFEKQMGHDCMEELDWSWPISFPFAG